jgi:hypothetical protein
MMSSLSAAQTRPTYERLVPYYVELGAASQFRSKLTGEEGDVAGHAALYFKGACKDENAPFPQLRRSRVVSLHKGVWRTGR